MYLQRARPASGVSDRRIARDRPRIERENNDLAASEQAIYTRRKRIGSFQPDEARRTKQIGQRNAWLRKLVTERNLEMEVMKEIAARNDERDGPSRAGGVCDAARLVAAAGLHAAESGALGGGQSLSKGAVSWGRAWRLWRRAAAGPHERDIETAGPSRGAPACQPRLFDADRVRGEAQEAGCGTCARIWPDCSAMRGLRAPVRCITTSLGVTEDATEVGSLRFGVVPRIRADLANR